MDPVAIPWYRSQLVRHAVALVAMAAVDHFKLTKYFAPADVTDFVDNFILVPATYSFGAVLWARFTQKIAPKITLTKKGADTINKAAQAPPQ